MTRVSVAVMAHPSRAALVGPLVERLGIPADMVSWDTDGVRWHTGRRAWEMADPAADWHVVIQDDALVCLDLPAGLAKALDHVPHEAILSLYVGRRRPLVATVENAVVAADAHQAAWIRMRALNWGVAIGAPTASIPGMLAWCDQQRTVPNYDLRIGRYYRDQLLWPTWCTHPALVDHAEVRSLCGHGDGRVAHRFIGENRSALDVDWAAGHVDMVGIDKMWRARQRRDRIAGRRRRGTMTSEREDHPMTSTDPFRPANARRVHVHRPATDPPAPATPQDPAEAADGGLTPIVGVAPADPGHTTAPEPVDAVPDGIDPPRRNDPKAAWVAYATILGATDADKLTKAQLIDRYHDDGG